ncbi:MAG: hypothetical protein Q4C49_12080 [Bacillota bacterium]|nr:hypothetical protein [Bacillota bacterium]
MESRFAAMISELIYQQFFLNQGEFLDFFERFNLNEFITLKFISRRDLGTVSLEETISRLQIGESEIKTIVFRLQEEGYVTFSNSDSEVGAYITISEKGIKHLHEQEEEFVSYYGKVIDDFGVQRMGKLLAMIKDLQKIMKAQVENDRNAGVLQH